MSQFTRRRFLNATLAAGAAALVGPGCAGLRSARSPTVMTVLGLIAAEELGMTLPHEHITTDFIGAEKAPQPRYDRDVAFTTVLPHLQALRQRGCRALFECTPNHIGRDVILLRRLAEASGLHIVTNTGYYGAVENRYLPRHAFSDTVEQLAARWLAEWRDGIDGTGVRPGFVKLGVGKGKLPELHSKLLRAAARVHLESGLAIAVHTGDGAAALDEIRILEEERVPPSALVWVHAQNDPGPTHIEAARRGAWVSLDGVSQAPGALECYQGFLAALKSQGLLGRALISHDDGWAVEGEGQNAGLKLFGNGNPAPYESIFTRLLPRLRESGFTEGELQALLADNPRQAFALRVPVLTAWRA